MSGINRQPDGVDEIKDLISRVDALERSTNWHIAVRQGTKPTVTVHASAGVGASGAVYGQSSDVAGRFWLFH